MSTTRCQAKDPSTCPYHGTGAGNTNHDKNIAAFFGIPIPSETPEQETGRLQHDANIHYQTFTALDTNGRKQYIQDISMDTYGEIVENLPELERNTFVTAQIVSDSQKDKIVQSYLEAAVWTATDDIGEPLSDSYDINDFAPEVKQQAYRDVEKFIADNPLAVSEAFSRPNYEYGGEAAVQFGHDFLLTRNGEGAGFWDRESLKAIDLGKNLTEATKQFRTVNTVVGDDGKLYLEG